MMSDRGFFPSPPDPFWTWRRVAWFVAAVVLAAGLGAVARDILPRRVAVDPMSASIPENVARFWALHQATGASTNEMQAHILAIAATSERGIVELQRIERDADDRLRALAVAALREIYERSLRASPPAAKD